MKRLITLLLCVFMLIPPVPAHAAVEDWVADINGISAKVLEWCMQEHETEMTLTLPASAIRGMTDDEIRIAVRDALDELSVAETAIGLTPAIAYFRSQLLYHLGDLPAAQAAADDAVRLDAEDPVSAAQTALYQQQSDLCSATIALLEPIE